MDFHASRVESGDTKNLFIAVGIILSTSGCTTAILNFQLKGASGGIGDSTIVRHIEKRTGRYRNHALICYGNRYTLERIIMRFAQHNSTRITGYATRYSVGLSKQFYHQNVRQGSPDKYLKAFNQLPPGCRESRKKNRGGGRFTTPAAIRGLRRFKQAFR